MTDPLRGDRLRRSVELRVIVGIVAAAIACRAFGSDSAAMGQTASPGASRDAKAVARQLVERAGIQRGVCAVLGRDGTVALELARQSQLLVHVREPDAAAVAGLRNDADAAGLGIDRLAVEHGTLTKLPYADHIVDLVVSTRITPKTLKTLPAKEVMRVLRPGGICILAAAKGQDGADPGVRQLKRWARSGGVEATQTWKDSSGGWIQFRKPAIAGTDDWTHWEHGPDNNPVSTDEAIKAPYMTQFLQGPAYIGMPAVTTAAGGRTFLAIGHIAHHRREWESLNKLVARSGYNGTILWERELPDGYMVHRSAFVAGEDALRLIDGDRCLILDPQTGEEKGEIRIPGLEGEWKWMAITDGVLYVLAGKPERAAQTMLGARSLGGWSWADLSRGYYTKPRVPWGFGRTLAAYRLDQKRLLWKHTEKSPIDSRALAIHTGKVFLYCPENYFRALDAGSGKVLWTNREAEVLRLIEQPARGLLSTPGFKSCCMAVATPEALIVQGQTRMNVIALSVADGSLLWTKPKTTNNPNAIYVDGKLVLGIGPGGSHVVIDPRSGEVLENLKFRKVSCVRLTASPDSFFCRGEGTLRFDRASKKVLIDGGIRPACNDGVLPAGGMLHIGPWQCDCNLSLIGACAKCSAGDFDFSAVEPDQLQPGGGGVEPEAPLEVSEKDWPTYRGNNHRAASSPVRLARAQRPAGRSMPPLWQYTPQAAHVPTVPTAAGGLVFVGGEDGKVRALDAGSGEQRWSFATSAPVKMPPTIWQDRAYFGSGDGYVYALEAATGRLLWRFRAAPVQRHIMVYGHLGSTWPVNTGVLVHEGVAYFAAGIIDYDGTHVYALDAKTGRVKWHNNTCGHLNGELRKGVSAQGNLTIRGDRLLLAGGNQVSPAPFDLQTGECSAAVVGQGRPKANGGKFVGVFRGKYPIAGGRTLYSSPRNVATKGSFVAHSGRARWALNYGGVPPAWDQDTVVLANFRAGKLTCFDADKVAQQIDKGIPRRPGARPNRWQTLAQALQSSGGVRWQSDLGQPDQFEVLSLAVCPGSVVAVVQSQNRIRSQPQRFLVALNKKDAAVLRPWRHELSGEPLPGGLLVDRRGCVVVTMLDGRVLCFGSAGVAAERGSVAAERGNAAP